MHDARRVSATGREQASAHLDALSLNSMRARVAYLYLACMNVCTRCSWKQSSLLRSETNFDYRSPAIERFRRFLNLQETINNKSIFFSKKLTKFPERDLRLIINRKWNTPCVSRIQHVSLKKDNTSVLKKHRSVIMIRYFTAP